MANDIIPSSVSSFTRGAPTPFSGYDINSILKERTKAISQSISDLSNQTINPIKSTISDLKAGISIIKDADQNFMNQLYSYKSETIDTINDYLGSLTGGKISLSDFGGIVTYRDGFKVDSDQLVRMASKTLGFNIGSLSSIGDDLTREFMSELNSMTLGLSDGLFQVDGGRVSIAGDWDYNIGNAVFDFLGNGSSTFKTVNNFAASNAILNTMLKQNAEIGFVQGYGAFKDMYLYESDYNDALISTIPTLLNRGDVESLNEILSILTSNSIDKVKASFPNFAETVLANFKLKEDVLPESHEAYKNLLLGIITKVNGENWMKKYTMLGWVLNVGLVTQISDDSKTILEREESLIPFLTSANMFTQMPAIDNFKIDFPDAVLL